MTKLQKITLEVRDKLKEEEMRRMTMLMGQNWTTAFIILSLKQRIVEFPLHSN